MKYGESATAQRRANGGDLLHLQAIADQRISLMGYRQTLLREGRPYLLLTVVQRTGPTQRTVPVAASASVVVRQIEDHFAQQPGKAMDCVIMKQTSKQGREYWLIMEPVEYERQQAQT